MAISVKRVHYHDFLLISIMAVLAGCGLIYEYLMAHYAGRILGALETTIYAMIGLMIVAMGIGAFYARTIKCPYSGFAWLETGIALLGGCAVLMMAGLFSFAYILPSQLQNIYGLHETISPAGGVLDFFAELAESLPYLFGLLLGAMVGMEIPLIARIREDVHQKHLTHNAGTIYGADYIGAGAGAAVWVIICIKLPIMTAAIATAAVNLVIGFVFLAQYHKRVKALPGLLILNGFVATMLLVLAFNGQAWMDAFNNMLFKDKVVFSQNTRFQHLSITERVVSRNRPSVLSFYINGHIQFASNDEAIYHGMLVIPPMLASARHDHVLVVGGGDGLALRDILQWQPKTVTLIDLDSSVVELFRGNHQAAPAWLSERLKNLNKNALSDERVEFIYDNAFGAVEELASQGKQFNTIIVDLPDPNHPDLNKLYSDYFYGKLNELLAGDGAISVQSTSPYHAREAFISIGKTLAEVGLTVEQYHANVPSFGEWGWSIGVRSKKRPSERIRETGQLPFVHQWVSYRQILAAFVFSDKFYHGSDSILVNKLNTPTVYNYHSDGWRKGKGIFFTEGLDF